MRNREELRKYWRNSTRKYRAHRAIDEAKTNELIKKGEDALNAAGIDDVDVSGWLKVFPEKGLPYVEFMAAKYPAAFKEATDLLFGQDDDDASQVSHENFQRRVAHDDGEATVEDVVSHLRELGFAESMRRIKRNLGVDAARMFSEDAKEAVSHNCSNDCANCAKIGTSEIPDISSDAMKLIRRGRELRDITKRLGEIPCSRDVSEDMNLTIGDRYLFAKQRDKARKDVEDYLAGRKPSLNRYLFHERGLEEEIARLQSDGSSNQTVPNRYGKGWKKKSIRAKKVTDSQ